MDSGLPNSEEDISLSGCQNVPVSSIMIDGSIIVGRLAAVTLAQADLRLHVIYWYWAYLVVGWWRCEWQGQFS